VVKALLSGAAVQKLDHAVIADLGGRQGRCRNSDEVEKIGLLLSKLITTRLLEARDHHLVRRPPPWRNRRGFDLTRSTYLQRTQGAA
jgi:hypothetical protein